MAKLPRSTERQVRIPYRESASYRAVAADSAVVLSKADEVGAVIQLNFTRNEFVIINEKYRASVEGSLQRQTSPSEFDQETIKVLECAVLMRPDQALQMVGAIMTQLTSLPPQHKLQYRLSDASLGETQANLTGQK